MEPDELTTADAFARLAVELHDTPGVEETVEAVVQFALQAVDCAAAGIALVNRSSRPEIAAVTDAAVDNLYRVQIEAGEGPLITAVETGQVVSIADMTTENRWGQAWAAHVEAAGFRSAVHLPLRDTDRTGAVLSLYGAVPGQFTEDDLAVAHILARHAAVAVATARQDRTMTQAVDARKLVGQAMGILMERFDLDGDRAFDVLRRYSQDSNRKLRDVAQDLIDTRKLPH